MKQYFVKLSGLATLLLMLHGAVSAQDNDDSKDKVKDKKHETVIIKSKGDKDVKLNVEIKDGKVFINGKPTDEFKDDDVTVNVGPETLALTLDGMDEVGNLDEMFSARSPFRSRSGAWSYASDSTHAFLGVSSKKEENVVGAKVTEVNEGSAAEKAGLKKGDVITGVNTISITDPEDLTRAVRKFKPKDNVTVTYKRDGKEEKATATLGHRRVSYNYNFNFKTPETDGMTLTMPPGSMGMGDAGAPRIYRFDRRPRLGIKAQDTEDGKGVKVLEIDEDSPAGKAGIKEGDIITSFDGKAVNSAPELADQAREAGAKNSFKVELTRDGKSREIEVKIPRKLKTADL